MKKICFFSGDITNSGGTERVGTIIANELSKCTDFEVSFVSLVEKCEEPFFKIDKNIQRFKLFSEPVRGLTNTHKICSRLIKLVKKEKIEIIIDIDGILDMYSLIAKLFTGVEVISWEHFNYYQHPTVGYRKYTRWLASKFSDGIITLTEEDKNYYLKNLNVKCKIEAIHNPITNLHQIKEYNKYSKIILSVGRLTHQKGFDILIEVAKEVFYKHSDWSWIILGEGEERLNLEKKIKEYGLESNIKLIGNVSNVEDYYMKTGIFVMTSRYEGLPMTLLEAKTYQLPVISFDIKTGPRECIIDKVNGFLVSSFNIDEMSEKINELIENPNKRIEMSQNALCGVENFELNNIINKWKKILS